MDTMKTAIAEIKSRGQLTIPKKIRESSHLEEGQVVSIIPVGDSVIITPKRLELDEARRQIRKIMKASGLSEKELIKGLGEEREQLYKEIYGKKSIRRIIRKLYGKQRQHITQTIGLRTKSSFSGRCCLWYQQNSKELSKK